MRRLPLALAGIIALAAGAALAQGYSFSDIERGRYLATVGNCIVCHTDSERDGIPWTGGREIHTPFGTIVTPNLTPDDDTGLGRWTRDDFWRALHEGVRRDGAQLYPALPYVYFTRMSRDEVDSIYEYLRTLEPVRAERTPEEELPAPLRIREAVLAWKVINFDQGIYEPDPSQTPEWNRGRYLVDGPAHCGACHTGKNLTGGDDANEYLRGGVLEGWYAPNIRGGQNGGIAHWSHDDIVAFLRTGRNSHTVAMNRMGAEVVVPSTQLMSEGDLNAIATYLKSLPDEPRGEADAAPEDAVQAGAGIYFDNCAACHRPDGEGVPYTFASLASSTKIHTDDHTTVVRIILEGAQAAPTLAEPMPFAMPAFAWKLTDEQIASLVTYLRNAWGNTGPALDASAVASIRDELAGDARE